MECPTCGGGRFLPCPDDPGNGSCSVCGGSGIVSDSKLASPLWRIAIWILITGGIAGIFFSMAAANGMQ